jgi:glucokinase
MRRVAVADVGGTHARFTFAYISEGRVARIDEPVTLQTAHYPAFEAAFEEFGERAQVDDIAELAIAFAGPAEGEVLSLTNSPWVIHVTRLKQRLGLQKCVVLNDFGAVAHAVATLPSEHFDHLCGPALPLPERGLISVVGPGTGLGVAALLKSDSGYHVIETEGGHIDFAPLDEVDDEILVELRRRFRRVSAERVASGRGLRNVYEALATTRRRELKFFDDGTLWAAALAGTDRLAELALERVILALGAVTGDLALAHGAKTVVIAGGVGLRLRNALPNSGFSHRFIAKGRFERRMSEMPVKLITHPEPGLWGAAAALASAID